MHPITLATRLPYGRGTVGQKYPLTTAEAQAEYVQQLSAHIKPLSRTDTVFCMEDRPIIALADGTQDPQVLAQLVTYQGPGGLGLWVTKAAVAADAAYLRDAKTFKQAYLTTVKMLTSPTLGYSEAAHDHCGASGSVEASVANQISEADLVDGGLAALTIVDEQTGHNLALNQTRKQHLLNDGFYKDWSAAWHESYVADNFPATFAQIAVDDSEPSTHGGHLASGVLVVQERGKGFAKNAFYQQTGKMAFGLTPYIVPDIAGNIAQALGGSHQERVRLMLELGNDTAHVTAGLVTEDFPAFLQAA